MAAAPSLAAICEGTQRTAAWRHLQLTPKGCNILARCDARVDRFEEVFLFEELFLIRENSIKGDI